MASDVSVKADDSGEDFGDLVEVPWHYGVEVDEAGVLDGSAQPIADLEADVARKLEEVVSRGEVVVRRVLRVLVDEREDVLVVDDALPGVDERPVMGAGVGHVERLDGIVVGLDRAGVAPWRPT